MRSPISQARTPPWPPNMALTFITKSSMVAASQGKGMSAGELTSLVGFSQSSRGTRLSQALAISRAFISYTSPVSCAHSCGLGLTSHISDRGGLLPLSLLSSSCSICPHLAAHAHTFPGWSASCPMLPHVDGSRDFQACFSTLDII